MPSKRVCNRDFITWHHDSKQEQKAQGLQSHKNHCYTLAPKARAFITLASLRQRGRTQQLPSDFSKRAPEAVTSAHEYAKGPEAAYMSHMLGITLSGTRGEYINPVHPSPAPGIMYMPYIWDYGVLKYQIDFIGVKVNKADGNSYWKAEDKTIMNFKRL